MFKFIIYRFAQIIPVIFGVALITFFMSRAIPGDPFSNEKASSPEQMQRIKEFYGLDKHITKQFFIWLGHAIKLDLGPSFKHKGYTVNEIISKSFIASLELGVWAFLFSLTLGIPIGMYSALKKNSLFDNSSMAVSILGICLPSFVIGPILLLIFSIWLEWFNPIGWETPSDRVLPTITLGLFFTAYISRLTRAGFLETLNQEYIKTAHAKGLKQNTILWKHAFKPSISPVITYLGPAAAHLLTGSFVVESIFFIPGLGRHFIESAFNQDYGVLMGVTLFYATILATFNIITDCLQIIIDPKQRF